MRLIKQQEMLQQPAGTLFAALIEKWVFSDLAIKGDTWKSGSCSGFWEHSIAWIADDNDVTPFDALEAMYDDPAQSCPMETAPTRHDCWDPEKRYLILEPADISTFIKAIKTGKEGL